MEEIFSIHKGSNEHLHPSIIIPMKMTEDTTLSAQSLRVYMILKIMEQEEVKFKYKEVQNRMNISRYHLLNSLRELEERNLLEFVNKKPKTKGTENYE